MKKFFKLLFLAFTLVVSLGADPSTAVSTDPAIVTNATAVITNTIPVTAATAANITPTATIGTSAAMPSMGVAIFRMVGSLAIVIALFFGAAWLFRNMHRFKAAGAANRKLQVLEAKSLGPRQAVYVVGYEQQRLLIGATPQGLTLLTHLPEGAPQPQDQPEQPAGQRILPVSFGEALMQALGRK